MATGPKRPRKKKDGGRQTRSVLATPLSSSCLAVSAVAVRFLVAQGERGVSLSVDGEGSCSRYSPEARDCMKKVPLFGALKGKIKFIAPDFYESLADFAEYM